jgi:GrpB-like predicted nucleotidyltransferase (UPF0157 family)
VEAPVPDTPPLERPPATDEELQAAWVGDVPRLDGPIHLADYDPEWPLTYEREATRIRSILGDRIRRLEHIGSTSVPGIPAKPIIDILLVLDDSGAESSYVPDLEAAGYRLVIREPDWHEHRVFKGPDTNINLHVYTLGDVEVDRYLVFRDWLRTHDDDRELYARTKRDLAARDWKYVQHYADAKSEVVEGIIERAGGQRRL